jgi:hypothetical protein
MIGSLEPAGIVEGRMVVVIVVMTGDEVMSFTPGPDID